MKNLLTIVAILFSIEGMRQTNSSTFQAATQKPDTFFCIMQFSDTSKLPPNIAYSVNGRNYLQLPIVYWQYGYWFNDISNNDKIVYLDDKKKRLDKNIMVWIAYSIKK